MNPISPFLPQRPEPGPPPKEEPPTPIEPADDIRKIGDRISDAADDVADKVEAFSDLLQDEQKDINEAVQTLSEIGKALELTGKDVRDGAYGVPPIEVEFLSAQMAVPIHQPSPEEIASLAVAILESQSKVLGKVSAETSEPSEESNQSIPPWLPWAVAGGVGIWGITRKKK